MNSDVLYFCCLLPPKIKLVPVPWFSKTFKHCIFKKVFWEYMSLLNVDPAVHILL